MLSIYETKKWLDIESWTILVVVFLKINQNKSFVLQQNGLRLNQIFSIFFKFTYCKIYYNLCE
jgi:hypothetical protein